MNKSADPQDVKGFSTTDPQNPGIGHNGGPAVSPPFSKTRWLRAIDHCDDPEKPMGAVAMGAVLFNEMDSKGEGAAVSDLEVARRLNCSERSVRDFKTWLRKSEFVAIAAKGRRGSVTIFKGRMPGEIPAPIAGNTDDDCRQPLPAINDEIPAPITGNPEIPANAAGIDPSPSCARAVVDNITKTNTSIGEEVGDRGSGGKGNLENEPTPMSVLEAFELYNEMAQRIGLSIAVTLTPQRRKSMKARMREHGGIEAWKKALTNIERSKFLQGSNDRSWRADLDFLCQAKSFTRVVEGGYGNGAHADVKSFEDDARKALEEVQRKKREAKQWTRPVS